jgi:pimeloyl-ACP methyl ester carboxylesterase
MIRQFVALALLLLGPFPARATENKPPRYRATRFLVANGIQQQYADWGGNGDTLLLLAGLGNDAYVFDTFASRLTDKFHVIGLTRRGFGGSDKPEGGYDTATRVEDIRAFLDVLKIRRVYLAGHSLAGDELTLFASKYPDRVLKLVYFDAAYNRYHHMTEMASDPFIASTQRAFSRAAIACMRASDGFRMDYRGVKAPALAFYATATRHPMAAKTADPVKRKQLEAWWTANMETRQRSSIEQFKREMRRGEVVEMPHAAHHLFLGPTQDQVVAKTRAFLLR